MTDALYKLNNEFKRWKNHEITLWELNKKIHHHHNVTTRILYKFYELFRDPKNAVARGISKGIIKKEAIQEDCWPLIERLIEYYDNE